MDSARIVLAAETILAAENLIDQGKTLSFFADDDYIFASLGILGVNLAYSQGDTFGGCLMDAVGITATFKVIQDGIKGPGKKGALKLIKKTAGRSLGPIGAALAAYDFADCMGWI